MKTNRVRATILATAVAIAALSGVAQATPVVYTIDATQSTIMTGGTLFGVPLLAQLSAGPGNVPPASNIDAVGGTIVGDWNLGILTLMPGSIIDPVLHPQAAAFLPPGTGVANVGSGLEGNLASKAATAGLIGIDTVAAIRDLVLDFPAGTITDGLAPAAMTIQFTAGRLSSNLGAASGLAGAPAANMTVLPAFLQISGLVETLKIPYTNTTVNGQLVSVTSGMIVATRQIPEPSTVVLAGLGVVGMALAAWRKRHAA